MELTEIDIRNLQNTVLFLLEPNNIIRTRWIRSLIKGKEQVRIVANMQIVDLYQDLDNVSCIYDPIQYKDLHTKRSSYFVFDDCFPDSVSMNDRSLNCLLSFPRILGITSVIGFQRHIAIPPRIRWNADFVCIGCILSNTARKRVYESFSHNTITFDDFCGLLDRYTQNQGLLVFQFNTIENGIFYAKLAQEISDTKQ